VDSTARSAIAVQLESILVQQMLSPIERSFGDFGGLPASFFAQAIAERDAARFSAALKLFR